MMFWKDRRILVTGGAGFVGSHLVETLVERGADVRVADNFSHGSQENLAECSPDVEFIRADLSDLNQCKKISTDVDGIFHLAAKVAGVGYNNSHPGTMFWENSIINLNMLEAARANDVERYLVTSSACVYARFAKVPTSEDEGFKDDPEPSNLGYGWAKRVAEVQARVYAQEYGMKIAIVRPYNCYGPRDDFDPDTGHVIPVLIRKAIEGQNPLVVWGNGQQTRSFVYVTDVAIGMALALELYPEADPINIGSHEEITIGDLAHLILDLSGTPSVLRFDDSKPSGQPTRLPDLSKAKARLNFGALVTLREGLRRTISWYKGTPAFHRTA